ncbi:DUF6924 domain-containing protein [Williamsia serinedens]|uniref:DUF6924 domain-containing protein n=1 Tax=Williamsia serinedens TaxID=391736 RepID=A0ABT1GXY2_9NOCA|nr:hypothetical protein [Williamsia serinedens]MCP2159402.1 hypothetical protein [Williamsia serinedens]
MTRPALLDDASVLIRADFTDDAAWQQLVEDAQAPSTPDEFMADLLPVDDIAWDGITAEQFITDVSPPPPYYVFIADHVTMTHPEHPILAVDTGPVDTGHEPGRTVRVIPSEMWSIENNLSLANMDFRDFADNASDDGIFRGF